MNGNIMYLPLTNTNEKVIIDKDDYAKVMSLSSKWFLYESNKYRRVLSLTKKTNTSTKYCLAREILPRVQKNSKLYIKHIDGNIFNCRKSNLEWISNGEVHKHQKKCNATSKYFGVVKNKSGGFGTLIKYNGKVMHLGTFKDELDAARAYNIFLRDHEDFSKFPKFNEIPNKFGDPTTKYELKNNGNFYINKHVISYKGKEKVTYCVKIKSQCVGYFPTIEIAREKRDLVLKHIDNNVDIKIAIAIVKNE